MSKEHIIEHQFQPGESGNPDGRPVGTRNLAVIVKSILEEGELDWAKLPIKNAHELAEKFGKRGWDALVYVAVAQGLSGNLKALEWLRRSQYGNKLALEVETPGLREESAKLDQLLAIVKGPTHEPNEPGSDTGAEAPNS